MATTSKLVQERKSSRPSLCAVAYWTIDAARGHHTRPKARCAMKRAREEETCPICLDAIVEDRIELPTKTTDRGNVCGHVFHEKCIAPFWRMHANACCPSCRTEVDAEVAEAVTGSLLPSVIAFDGPRLQELLEAGADANADNGENGSPLAVACRLGFLEGVNILLKHGADVHERDPMYDKPEFPLEMACRCGEAAVVARLLQAGADVNASKLPLLTAVKFRHLEVVGLLLDEEIEHPIEHPSYIEDALLIAAGDGNKDIVEMLVEEAPCAASSECCTAALARAIANGYVGVARYLLSETPPRADRHAECVQQSLPRVCAAGNTAMVALLLAQGATLCGGEEKPLVAAARNGRLRIVKMLVSAGAQVTASNNAAIKAADTSRHEPVVSFLKLVGGTLTYKL
jgi:ankyrin repeat protein